MDFQLFEGHNGKQILIEMVGYSLYNILKGSREVMSLGNAGHII